MPKNVILPFYLLSAQSMAASFSSSPVNIQFLDNISLQIFAPSTGSPTGTVSVEVSNDYNPNTHNSGHWDALVLSPSPVFAGAAQYTIDMNQLGSAYLRVTYTRTSGSGSLTAILTAKQV